MNWAALDFLNTSANDEWFGDGSITASADNT